MTPNNTSPLFRVGDRVKIRHWDWRARIVEFRGPLGLGGCSFIAFVSQANRIRVTSNCAKINSSLYRRGRKRSPVPRRNRAGKAK